MTHLNVRYSSNLKINYQYQWKIVKGVLQKLDRGLSVWIIYTCGLHKILEVYIEDYFWW